MGFPMARAFAWAAVLSEFFGGILLILGLFARPAAFFIAVIIFVAAFVYHKRPLQQGLTAVIYFFMSVSLMLAGPGRVSLDALLAGRFLSALSPASNGRHAQSGRDGDIGGWQVQVYAGVQTCRGLAAYQRAATATISRPTGARGRSGRLATAPATSRSFGSVQTLAVRLGSLCGIAPYAAAAASRRTCFSVIHAAMAPMTRPPTTRNRDAAWPLMVTDNPMRRSLTGASLTISISMNR